MLSRGDLRRVAGLLGVRVVDLFEGDDDDIEISNTSPNALYREKHKARILPFLD